MPAANSGPATTQAGSTTSATTTVATAVPSVTPVDIAREAFKRILQHKLLPTPDIFQFHYRQVYREVKGEIAPDDAPAPAAMGDGALRSGLLAILEICAEAAGAFERTQYPAPEVNLRQELQSVINGLKAIQDPALGSSSLVQLEGLRARLKVALRDQVRLQPALINLLRLVVDNIHSLSLGNEWLRREMAVVSETLDRPINVTHIDRLHHQLQEMLVKQRSVKNNMSFAQERMKDMLTSFMEHLLHFSQDTEKHQEKMQDYSQRIGQAKSVDELGALVQETTEYMKNLQNQAQHSREKLEALRRRAVQAEGEIARLQNELAHNSELIRLDPLTGVLNRKGMEEALERSLRSCRQRHQPLSCILLDIDDFKMLNDGFGHQAGDEALMLLARLICEHVTEQDSVVRYGGEEFFILLHNCDITQAIATAERIRASLARRTLIYQRKAIPLAFSAGVCQMDVGSDSPLKAIQLADQALYQAKREGKDRICRAPLPVAA